MIQVIVYRKNNQNIGFQSMGHAGYDDAGLDIICSAVSILTINTMNAIEMFTDDKFSQLVDEAGAEIDFKIKGQISRDAALLLDAMVLGLQSLADDDSYKDYLDVTYEEV